MDGLKGGKTLNLIYMFIWAFEFYISSIIIIILNSTIHAYDTHMNTTTMLP